MHKGVPALRCSFMHSFWLSFAATDFTCVMPEAMTRYDIRYEDGLRYTKDKGASLRSIISFLISDLF